MNLFAEAAVGFAVDTVRHPNTQATMLRICAASAGKAAGKMEYSARSLRRTEAALYAKASQVEQSAVSADTRALWQIVRDCWKE